MFHYKLSHRDCSCAVSALKQIHSQPTKAYVGSAVDETLSVIDVATRTVTSTIPIGGSGEFMAIMPDGANVSVSGPGSDVPELTGEHFGVAITSTQPIAVERSLCSSVNGVQWAAGTNATATRLP